MPKPIPIDPETVWRLLDVPVFFVRPQAAFEIAGGKPAPWGYLKYFQPTEDLQKLSAPWVFASMGGMMPAYSFRTEKMVDSWFAAGRVSEYDHDPFV